MNMRRPIVVIGPRRSLWLDVLQRARNELADDHNRWGQTLRGVVVGCIEPAVLWRMRQLNKRQLNRQKGLLWKTENTHRWVQLQGFPTIVQLHQHTNTRLMIMLASIEMQVQHRFRRDQCLGRNAKHLARQPSEVVTTSLSSRNWSTTKNIMVQCSTIPYQHHHLSIKGDLIRVEVGRMHIIQPRQVNSESAK